MMNDVIKENQRKALKGQPLGKKLGYIFYYYKWYMLAAILVILLLVDLGHTLMNRKDKYLQVAYVNCDSTLDYQAFIDEYAATTDMDPKTQEMTVDSSYLIVTDENQNGFDNNQIQKLWAATATGELDVIICDEANFNWISQMGYFKNLEDVLTPEELEEYGDRLTPASIESDVDGSVSEEIAGIDISDSSKVKNSGWYTEGAKVYVGIVMESEATDRAMDFIRYLDE